MKDFEVKAIYKGTTNVSLTNGKEYEVIAVENGWLRIVDDTDDDYLFSPDDFEVTETHTML